MINEDFARIYRETVGRAGREGIARREAEEEATAIILVEIRAGRLKLDPDTAVRAALREIDSRDGRSADRVLKAAALGDVPLLDSDIDIIVTLGLGLRKQWADIDADDLLRMDNLRHANVEAAQKSYNEWRRNYSKVLPVLFEYGSFGAARDAGGFPPKSAAESAVA